MCRYGLSLSSHYYFDPGLAFATSPGQSVNGYLSSVGTYTSQPIAPGTICLVHDLHQDLCSAFQDPLRRGIWVLCDAARRLPRQRLQPRGCRMRRRSRGASRRSWAWRHSTSSITPPMGSSQRMELCAQVPMRAVIRARFHPARRLSIMPATCCSLDGVCSRPRSRCCCESNRT